MIIKNQDINRYQIINNLPDKNNVGIELGVAEGNFSEKMLCFYLLLIMLP